MIDTRVYQFISTEIVIARRTGAAPPTVVAPPPGYVQITPPDHGQYRPDANSTAERIVPWSRRGASPTPPSGLQAESPARAPLPG